MKVNFQKIFAIIFVVCVMCCFTLSVSADTTSSINGGITSGGGGNGGSRTEYGNVLNVYLDSLGDYLNGDITIDEFLEKSNQIITESENEISDRLGMGLIEDINNGIVRAVDAFGDNAAYYINKWYQDFLDDYTDLAQIESSDNPDKKGYGAVAKGVFASDPNVFHYFYADYIVLYPQDESGTVGVFIANCPSASTSNSDGVYYLFYRDGSLFNSTYYGASYSVGYNTTAISLYTYVYEFYGDIRYEDGTQAPTNDEYVDTEVLDFSDSSDDELEKLLEDLLNALNLEMPDLSTMEGLLESIYNRLGTLDSDNDNELLSQVLVAIQNLQPTDNSDLLSVLEEIRDSLTDGKDNSEEENEDLINDLSGLLTVEDFVIDEEAYRNNSAILKLRLQEKFIFTDELKNLVTYTFNSYSNASENPQLNLKYNDKSYVMDLSAYDEYMPTLRFIFINNKIFYIAAFTYITYAYHTYRKIPSYINGGDNE